MRVIQYSVELMALESMRTLTRQTKGSILTLTTTKILRNGRIKVSRLNRLKVLRLVKWLADNGHVELLWDAGNKRYRIILRRGTRFWNDLLDGADLRKYLPPPKSKGGKNGKRKKKRRRGRRG